MKTTEFDGRVASMLQGDTARGYLFVIASESGCADPGPYITLEFLRRSNEQDEHSWFYSDRADPSDYDTAAELASATVDWYGTSYAIQWLPDDEAVKIKAYFDDQQPSTKRLLNAVFGRTSARPKVKPDPG